MEFSAANTTKEVQNFKLTAAGSGLHADSAMTSNPITTLCEIKPEKCFVCTAVQPSQLRRSVRTVNAALLGTTAINASFGMTIRASTFTIARIAGFAGSGGVWESITFTVGFFFAAEKSLRGWNFSSCFKTGEKCNVCMALSLKGRHKCIERNLESDCPVCGDYMFTSTTTVIFMPCGHW